MAVGVVGGVAAHPLDLSPGALLLGVQGGLEVRQWLGAAAPALPEVGERSLHRVAQRHEDASVGHRRRGALGDQGVEQVVGRCFSERRGVAEPPLGPAVGPRGGEVRPVPPLAAGVVDVEVVRALDLLDRREHGQDPGVLLQPVPEAGRATSLGSHEQEVRHGPLRRRRHRHRPHGGASDGLDVRREEALDGPQPVGHLHVLDGLHLLHRCSVTGAGAVDVVRTGRAAGLRPAGGVPRATAWKETSRPTSNHVTIMTKALRRA